MPEPSGEWHRCCVWQTASPGHHAVSWPPQGLVFPGLLVLQMGTQGCRHGQVNTDRFSTTVVAIFDWGFAFSKFLFMCPTFLSCSWHNFKYEFKLSHAQFMGLSPWKYWLENNFKREVCKHWFKCCSYGVMLWKKNRCVILYHSWKVIYKIFQLPLGTIWGWAEKFIGWLWCNGWIWPMWLSFQHSLLCGPHTSSIGVAALGFPWYRSSHRNPRKSPQLQIWPHHQPMNFSALPLTVPGSLSKTSFTGRVQECWNG